MANPDNQTCIHASRLAYIDDAAGYLNIVLPGYTMAKSDVYEHGDGFRAIVLHGSGGPIVAFRGTVLDPGKTAARVLNLLDDLAAPEFAAIMPWHLRRIEDDINALVRDATLNDLINDVHIFDGIAVAQFQVGLDLVRRLQSRFSGPITVTGHSLGGGIANYVAGQVSGLTGIAYAAPGYAGYGKASAAGMVNYANANDTIAMVNYKDHCGGPPIKLDLLHSSFAVEHELGYRSEALWGFNGTPDISTATTADTRHARTIDLMLSSIGFLVARLIYHDLANYAALLGCAILDNPPAKGVYRPRAKTIQDFAAASRAFVQDARILRRRQLNIMMAEMVMKTILQTLEPARLLQPMLMTGML